MKTTVGGVKEWDVLVKTDSSTPNVHYSIQQTSDDGYILGGSLYYIGNSMENYSSFFKVDSLGRRQWYKRFGGVNEDRGFSVQQTNDNGYVLAGMTESFGHGSSDIYLITVDEYGNDNKTGTLLWDYSPLGIVVSSPAVANGDVFIGTTDDSSLYCFQGESQHSPYTPRTRLHQTQLMTCLSHRF